MTLNLSGQCVFRSKTTLGDVQKVYVMYHGTSAANAASIIQLGFKPSTRSNTVRGMMLGEGVYVSRDIMKAMRYGKVVLKLPVYPGKTCQITTRDLLLRSSWQISYDSAWIPPGCGNPLVPSGLEENCVKDVRNILVLGVVLGNSLVQQDAGFQSLAGFNRVLPNEEGMLKTFSENLRLGYFYLRNRSTDKLLCVEEEAWSRGCRLVERVNRFSCPCHALWSWEGETTLPKDSENTGRFLGKLSRRVPTVKSVVEDLFVGQVTCYMADNGVNYPVWTENTKRCQLFTPNTSGEMLHWASSQFLTIIRDVNNSSITNAGLGHTRDYWDLVYCGLCPTCDREVGELTEDDVEMLDPEK